MKEKCPDIDTSTINIETQLGNKNYYELDINSLEKEFEKRKKEYEKERKQKEFKKARIENNNNNSNVNIDNKSEKTNQHSLYELEEPMHKRYLGVIILFLIILIIIVILIILISVFASNNNIKNEKKMYNKNINYL